jgi:2-oxoisovalerate dehydrogenase E1 component beta subunit
MPVMNMIQAVNDALKIEMRRDPRVLVMGEDVGKFGGVFRATLGLYEEFGPDRSIDTPLSEGGIIGTAIGMAVYGMKPVAEIQFADYIYPAFDQIVNELAKYRYRSGGQYPASMVIRTPSGGGIKGGHYHSQSPEAYFIHTPGLKVVMPSNPTDAKGLLASSIRDEDPVIFFEPKRVYRGRPVQGRIEPWDQDVPEGEYLVPLEKASVLQEGSGLTLVSWGAMVHETIEAARLAADEGIDCEVIDLRTLWPLDVECLIASVKKTGRIVIVHEAPKTCGFGAELMALVNERAFLHLEAPPARVTGWDTPFPYTLEMDYLPLVPRILKSVRETARF